VQWLIEGTQVNGYPHSRVTCTADTAFAHPLTNAWPTAEQGRGRKSSFRKSYIFFPERLFAKHKTRKPIAELRIDSISPTGFDREYGGYCKAAHRECTINSESLASGSGSVVSDAFYRQLAPANWRWDRHCWTIFLTTAELD